MKIMELLRKRLKAVMILLILLATCCSAQINAEEIDTVKSGDTIQKASELVAIGNSSSGPLPAIKAPDLISPSGPSSTASPTYIWKAVSASQYYCLEVKDDEDNIVFKQWYKASDLPSTPNCSVTPERVLEGGDYTWRVQSWNCNGQNWSDEMQFSVCSATVKPDRATLVSPKEITGSKNPEFVWKAVKGCTQYCLKVAKASDPNNPLLEKCYDSEDVLSDDLCSITPVLDLSAGTYRWWIQTKNCQGDGPWSSYLSFKYQNKAPGRCIALAPEGLTSTATPKFTWTAAAGAVTYHLQLDNLYTRVLDEWYDATEVTVGAKCYAFLPISLTDGIYFWRVQAENDAGKGAWSSQIKFDNVCAIKKNNTTIDTQYNSSAIEKKDVNERTVRTERSAEAQ